MVVDVEYGGLLQVVWASAAPRNLPRCSGERLHSVRVGSTPHGEPARRIGYPADADGVFRRSAGGDSEQCLGVIGPVVQANELSPVGLRRVRGAQVSPTDRVQV